MVPFSQTSRSDLGLTATCLNRVTQRSLIVQKEGQVMELAPPMLRNPAKSELSEQLVFLFLLLSSLAAEVCRWVYPAAYWVESRVFSDLAQLQVICHECLNRLSSN